MDELLANMSDAKYFSKLDHTTAYLQMPLVPASREYVTVNTHKGSTTASPSVLLPLRPFFSNRWKHCFKAFMALVFTLMISSSHMHNLVEHLSHLAEVLSQLENAGLHLNCDKCFFLRSSVEYFGHIVDAQSRESCCSQRCP